MDEYPPFMTPPSLPAVLHRGHIITIMKKPSILSPMEEAQKEHEYWERKLAAMRYALKFLEADIKVAEKQVQIWQERMEKRKEKR